MKPSFKLAFLAFSVLSASPAVLAQNYNGSVADLNTIFDPPMNISGTLCDVNVNTGNEHAYKACSDGVSAARWMAEKYAKNTGKYLGCLDGYYQGVTDGFNSGINPTQEMIKQAEAYVKGANFDSASSRGMDLAKAEGRTESADQIISRYRSVVELNNAQGRQSLPNKDYNYPVITFNGLEDGYEFDILRQAGSDFDAVYATGWVTKDSKFEDRLAARRALALQKEYAASLCNQTDTIFGRRSTPIVSIWDLFRKNRKEEFQSNGWRNPDWAWEIFDRDERTLEQYQTFARLKTLEKTVSESVNITERVLRTDAAGNPVRRVDGAGVPVVDAAGKPVFEYDDRIVGSRVETRRVKLSDAEVQALTNIYINGFKQAYDRFYARQYASINYNQEGMEKYKIAKIIGNAMAQEVAGHIARREAYNTQYKLQSAKKYAEEVKRMYKASFDHLIDIFENNAVVELNSARVVGTKEDGIFSPAEDLKVEFSVTNLGEKAAQTTLAFASTNDVIGNQGFVFAAPVLKSTNYVSTVIGRTNENLQARSSVGVAMMIKNPGDLAEVAKPLVVRKDQDIKINNYVEIDNAYGDLDYLAGKMTISVSLKNPARGVDSPISLVEASIGDLGSVDKNVEPIAAGANRPVLMNIEGMDPLKLILSGSVNGAVRVRLANKVVHSQSFSNSVGDKTAALVTYFDALATKRTNNSGNTSKADRLAKLATYMEELLTQDIERNVRWDKETAGTIIGKIQSVYNETKRSGRVDGETTAAYLELGKALASHVTDSNFRAGGGLRLSSKGNKEDFLKEIAKFAKISTKLKDWER